MPFDYDHTQICIVDFDQGEGDCSLSKALQ